MSLLSNSRNGLILAGVLTASLVSTLSSHVHAEGTVRLNFGVYSSNKPSAMVKVYRPILKELEASMSAKLGRDVDIRMQIAKDYDQGISHLINGRVDFSKFGPASYIEAKRMNKDISILSVENVKNSKVFYGIIAVRKDSPIQSIGELRGKSFAFGDEGSTIGRFLSQLELEQAGIRAGDLSRYDYLGRHDKVGTAVGAGSFDAGALNEKTFVKLVDAGENIRELVRFPNVTKPWIARSGLEPDVLEALRESLLQVKSKKTLATLKIDGFLEGNDDDYKVIRKAMENNQAFFAEHEKTEVTEAKATSNIVHEPLMQAAEQAPMATSTTSHASSMSEQPVNMNHVHQTNNRLVTVNITLPRSLFEANNPNSPNTFTINLTIPDDEVGHSSTTQPAQ